MSTVERDGKQELILEIYHVLETKLPWKKTPDAKEKRKQLFKVYNGTQADVHFFVFVV
jgi:hypothetical protein